MNNSFYSIRHEGKSNQLKRRRINLVMPRSQKTEGEGETEMINHCKWPDNDVRTRGHIAVFFDIDQFCLLFWLCCVCCVVHRFHHSMHFSSHVCALRMCWAFALIQWICIKRNSFEQMLELSVEPASPNVFINPNSTCAFIVCTRMLIHSKVDDSHSYRLEAKPRCIPNIRSFVPHR